MLKRIILLLTVAMLVVVMAVVTAAPAFAAPGGKGDRVGGGDTANQKDEPQAQKVRTGGGPLHKPQVCGVICNPL